jgi:hypothetical protein
MSILFCFPAPVPLVLGDVAVLVPELRLRQIADLQVWLRDRTTVVMPEPPGGDDADTWKRYHAACFLATEHWPPDVFGPEGDRAMATPEGLLELCRVILPPANPALTHEQLIAVVVALATEPLSLLAFHRAVYGVRPRDAAVDGYEWWEGLRKTDSTPIDWPKAIVEVMREYPAYTLEAVGELTISQFRTLRSGGEPGRRSLKTHDGESKREAWNRWAAVLDEARGTSADSCDGA